MVKAFATLGSQIIDDPLTLGGPVSVPLASDHRDAKEEVARIVAALGLDPVDFGPLRMSRHLEAMQLVYMIPLVQNRRASWEFYFRRTSYWYCTGQNEEWYEAVADAGNLAQLPETQGATEDCP